MMDVFLGDGVHSVYLIICTSYLSTFICSIWIKQLTLQCLSIGSPKTIHFPFVSNGKLMVFMCPNIQAHYNEAVNYLKFGTPEIMNFPLEQMENLLVLGVPIHKHIRVINVSNHCSSTGRGFGPSNTSLSHQFCITNLSSAVLLSRFLNVTLLSGHLPIW